MAQAAAARTKINAEVTQPAPRRTSRRPVEAGLGIVVYPPVAAGEPWRAVFTENGRRRFRQDVTEAGLAAEMEKVRERLSAGQRAWSGPAQEAELGRRYGQATGLAAVTDGAPEPLDRTDQRPKPDLGHTDHPDQATDHPGAAAGQVPAAGGPSRTDTGGDIAAAVAAYRGSARQGALLSERKLGGMFGKSRRWARSRMAEARQSPVPA